MDTDGRGRAAEAEADEGNGSVKSLSSFLEGPEYFDAMCERMTDWTLEQWDDFYRKRRSEDMRRRKIRPGRPLDHDKMVEMMSMYGFEGDDFYCKMVDVSEVCKWDLNFQPPICAVTGKTPQTVKRWFLKPDKLPI